MLVSESFMDKKMSQYRNNNAYSVPEGYFERLPDAVMSRLAQEKGETVAFSQEQKEDDFPVPAGYFDTLPEVVMRRAQAAAAAKELSVATEEKDFPVPAGYFEALPDRVSERIAAEASQRLVLRRRVLRIASAAAVGLLLVGVGFFFAHRADTAAPATSDRMTAQATPRAAEAPAAAPAETIDMDKELAHADIPEQPKAKPARVRTAAPAPVATDPQTDQFIAENLTDDELDEMDYDILDYYTDDLAVADMWDF